MQSSMLARMELGTKFRGGLIPDLMPLQLCQGPVRSTNTITGALQSARNKARQECDWIFSPVKLKIISILRAHLQLINFPSFHGRGRLSSSVFLE